MEFKVAHVKHYWKDNNLVPITNIMMRTYASVWTPHHTHPYTKYLFWQTPPPRCVPCVRNIWMASKAIFQTHSSHHHHHHQLNVHFLPRLIKSMDGCFPTALGRQPTFSNILGPLIYSHSDASISRKSCLFTILKAAVYPWECWSKFLAAGCPSSHQPSNKFVL